VSDDVKRLLDRVCELIAERIDAAQIATARRRHADMLAGRTSDYIPMTFGQAVPEAADLPDFNWNEQCHDPAKRLYMQLKDGALARAAADGDGLPAVRADTGVVNCMSVLGAEYVVPEHTKPVVSQYVPKEDLAAFEVPDDVADLGTMPRVIEHMEHHLGVLRAHGLDETVRVCHCDQQGPFDVAAQAHGHDIFIDLYEDPDFVRELMDKTTQVYIAVSKLCKRLSSEPVDGGQAVDYWMDNGGVRM